MDKTSNKVRIVHFRLRGHRYFNRKIYNYKNCKDNLIWHLFKLLWYKHYFFNNLQILILMA